jgi:hypothetical protein
MPLAIKPSGSISYTEINTAVVNGGGFATSSFNGLNSQAYTLTNSSVYLPPDKFSEFVGTSGNVFTFSDWNGTVSVSSLGAVTFTVGNAVSVSITSTLSYDLVGADTSRTISVSIVVPNGFSNAGVTLTGTKTAIQPARNFAFADWTGGISINQEGIVSATLGNASAVTFTPASFPVVSSNTDRVVSVTVTPPSGYFNAGTPLAAVNVTVTQPAKLFTYSMWTGVLSVSCDGVISATTGNAATPITFSPTSYPAVDVATPRAPQITITVPSGYGNSGQTLTDTTGIKTATQPAKFLTTTWTGVVSINRNTGVVSATTGNAASIQSITPSTIDLVTTSTNKDITVVVVIPSGYCNSGTLSIVKTISQAAADETINITLAGSPNTFVANPQGDSAALSVFTIPVWNTAWTITASNSVWIIIEGGGSGTNGTGTQENFNTIAFEANYTGKPGFDGATRFGSITVYKTSDNTIFDTIQIQQAVGTAPVSAPTFTMSGKTHTFEWFRAGSGDRHTIGIAITGGNQMTYGAFSMFNNDFAFYQTDSNVIVNGGMGNWEAIIDNKTGTNYSVGVYPIEANTSTTTTKTATIDFIASNASIGGGANSDSATITQEVSPPTFTMANAGITGFAVAANGSISAPQAAAGTITNRVYSSGGSYGRVCFDTERSVVVYVRVPISGWSNSNDIINDTYYANQPSSPTFSFGTWDGSVSVAQNGTISINVGNAGSATINTGNFGVTYGSDVTRTISVTVTAPSAYCNSGEQFTDNKTAIQQGTPLPTLSMNVSVDCTDYVGSGYIQITSVTGGSGNYTYHIDSTSNGNFDENNPNTYNLNSSLYGLSNGTYDVAVYDNFYNIYAYEIRTVSCASPPTFYFTDWNGSVSVAQNGTISTTNGNATVVSVNTSNFGVVYNDTSRTINVTITVPGGYSNSGNQLSGDRMATQPASTAEIAVTVYTRCDNGLNYFIEGTYYYPNIEIEGYCAYYAFQDTKSNAQANGYTEAPSYSYSGCTC